MPHLILIRHGESEWNKRNIFTGWVDIPLSLKGIEEALEGGRTIQEMEIDEIHTSCLNRALMTALLVMNVHSSGKIPVVLKKEEDQFHGWSDCHNPALQNHLVPLFQAWELNERMYGELQGKNKDEMRAQYGAAQIQLWRRSYDVAPPGGESLKMTKERTLPYFNETIVPKIKMGKNILISAHGNSLRSIVMQLDHLSEEEVVNLEIPTGKPIIYSYEQGGFRKWI